MRRLGHVLLLAGLLGSIPALTAYAGEEPGAECTAEWRYSGSASVEARIFTSSAEPSPGGGASSSLSVSVAPEIEASWKGGDRRLVFTPFARWDQRDDERSHVDVRELYWHRVERNWELVVGVRQVFWGVTESRHLVDFVNQSDLVEDLDAEAKLGQPMIQLRLVRDWGLLDLFVLPGFRERTFPELGARPALGPIDPDRALYASDAEDGHVDLAVRWSRFVGAFDIGVAAFRGTDREPFFVADPRRPGVLLPFYDQVDRLSLDLQGTFDAWLWKLEAVAQEAEVGEDHLAAVAGFEYTFFDVGGTGLDVGVLGELLVDDRDERSPTPFEDDVFVGSRLAWNDVAGTELLVGAIVDRDGGEAFWTLEASRRLGSRFQLALELRAFTGVDDGSLLVGLRDDDYVQLEISRFF